MADSRYAVLDSWRGISACMVALFHFLAYSHITSWKVIQNAYLLVDLFFVLSGFVIAANYRSRIAAGFEISRFAMLRFGRIYPLHLVMMLLFIPIEWAKGIGNGIWRAVGSHAALIHGLGVNDTLQLDFPSWSISTEFAAYLVFAFVVARFGERLLPWLVPIVVGPLVLGIVAPNGMESTYDYGFVRCLYGFALGVVCFDLRERIPALKRPLGPISDTSIEMLAFAAVIAGLGLISTPHGVAVASPFLFAVVVLVFAREGGAVSRLLSVRPLLLIGTLSYSIYMVHALVRALARATALALEHRFGWSLFVDAGLSKEGETIRWLWIDGSLWLGDLVQIGMLAATIALAVLTHRMIEEPGRRWGRRLAMSTRRNAPLEPNASA